MVQQFCYIMWPGIHTDLDKSSKSHATHLTAVNTICKPLSNSIGTEQGTMVATDSFQAVNSNISRTGHLQKSQRTGTPYRTQINVLFNKKVHVPKMQHNTSKTFLKTVLSFCHFVLLSYCPFVLLSFCPFVLLSFFSFFFLSFRPFVQLSFCPLSFCPINGV